MAFELDSGLFDSEQGRGVSIRIVGVGGCGGNAVNNMIERKISGVEYIVFNTDRQALLNSKAQLRVQIGKRTTNGLGAGADPVKGQQAADDDRDIIAAQLKGADLVFIAAGMGKGTGTGAAPVIAAIARNMGILTIGVVTMPFNFEGKVKLQIAEGGITELRKSVDTLIIVENEKVRSLAEEGSTATEALNMANDVLYRSAKGIADIITSHGHINVDFADVCSIMSNAGDAVMGTAAAAGERRALKASSDALNSPLLEGVSVKGAQGVLVNITGKVTMTDMSEAMSYIEKQVGSEARIIHGYVDEPQLTGEIRVTVIVTGFKRLAQDEIKEAVVLPPASPSYSGRTGSTANSLQEQDLRIPAYLRRNVAIQAPREQGKKQKGGHER
ncbi:MAG: cell division protein FtsZ [Chlorobiaceae bacterium]|nr:cell division protein FtsZ [Chlorobiaceae bacterium]